MRDRPSGSTSPEALDLLVGHRAQPVVTQTTVASPGAGLTSATLPWARALPRTPAHSRALQTARRATPSTNQSVRTGVAVTGDVSLSTTLDYTTFEGALCSPVAVPGGTDPSDLTNFAGPLIANGRCQLYAHAGTQDDHYASRPQVGAFMDYDSHGSCGLCDMAIYGEDHRRARICSMTTPPSMTPKRWDPRTTST